MSVLELARKDFQRIVTDLTGFGVSIQLTAKTGEMVTVTGLHKHINVSVDGDGVPVNATNATITLSERALNDLSYPVRDSDGEVYLINDIVKVADINGDRFYKIRETMPDETLGSIVCLLDKWRDTTTNDYIEDDYIDDYFE